ncbi:hypothetical protein [Schlesneria sp.]|uniref:hypothetical protein n=1 Tax=Schlesneria sp. TaxID=2762018 RepID=UPI002F24017B
MNQEQAIRELEERYREVRHSLNERQRRLWAANEALQRGWGGISLVSKVLRISPNTIKRGIAEIQSEAIETPSESGTRIRKPGGGRKAQQSAANRLTPPDTLADVRGNTTNQVPTSSSSGTRKQGSPGNSIDCSTRNESIGDEP